MALRGRVLVGSRPVDSDFVRRFIASAAQNGIDVFRLNDPLNDVSNLREAAEAIADAGAEFAAGLVYSSGPTGETEPLVAQARKLPEPRRDRVSSTIHGIASAGIARGARRAPREASGACRSASTAVMGAPGRQRARGRAEALGVRGLILSRRPSSGCARRWHRVSGESLAEALAARPRLVGGRGRSSGRRRI